MTTDFHNYHAGMGPLITIPTSSAPLRIHLQLLERDCLVNGLWSSLVAHIPVSHTAIAQGWLAHPRRPASSSCIDSYLFKSLWTYNCQAVSALADIILDIINQYSTRWSDFDLVMPQSCFYQFFFFHATDHHAPMESYPRAQNLFDSPYKQRCRKLIPSANLSAFEWSHFIICSTWSSRCQWMGSMFNRTIFNLHSSSMSIIDSFLIPRNLNTSRLVFVKFQVPATVLTILYSIGASVLNITVIEISMALHAASRVIPNFWRISW